MFMTRRATFENRGIKSREINSPKISWNSQDESVIIRASQVKDFSNNTTDHDYEYKLNLAEIGLIIEAIGGKASCQSGGAIAEALSPYLREIMRLQNTCIGTTLK